MSDAFDPQPTVANEPVPGHHLAEGVDTRTSTVGKTSQSFSALVWRRLRRSVPGMLGLVLVSLLLFVSVFAYFFAPVDPKGVHVAFAPPDKISFYVPDSGWQLRPVAFPTVEGEEFDPVTFQPIIGPDYDNPRPISLFVKGFPYTLFGLIPLERHFFGLADGTPLHLLGTDKLGRDILSRGIVGSQISLAIALISIALITVIGTLAGIASGYIGGRFDNWLQRFVEVILAFPQLPLYLALTTLIPVTAPSSLFLSFVVARHRRPRLGAARARGAGQDHGARPRSSTCAPRWRSGPATGASSPGTSCRT